MSEEEIKKEEPTAGDTGKGDKPEELTEVDKIHAAAKRMEKANEARTKVIQEEKELEAKKILGGQTTASQVPEKKEEVSDEQYYKDVMSGKFNVKRE